MKLLHSLDSGSARVVGGDLTAESADSKIWLNLVEKLERQNGFSCTSFRFMREAADTFHRLLFHITDESQLRRLIKAYRHMFIPDICVSDNGVHMRTLRDLMAIKPALWGWIGYHESAYFRLSALIESRDIHSLQSHVQKYIKMNDDGLGQYHFWGSTIDRDNKLTPEMGGKNSEAHLSYSLWGLDDNFQNIAHRAIKEDFLDITYLLSTIKNPLISENQNFNQRDRWGYTPIHLAASELKVLHLKQLISISATDVTLLSANNKNILHLLFLRLQTRWSKIRKLYAHHAYKNDVRHRLDPSPATIQEITQTILSRAGKQKAVRLLFEEDNSGHSAIEMAMGTKDNNLLIILLQQWDLLKDSRESIKAFYADDINILFKLLKTAILIGQHDMIYTLGKKFMVSNSSYSGNDKKDKAAFKEMLTDLILLSISRGSDESLQALFSLPKSDSNFSLGFLECLNISGSCGMYPLELALLLATGKERILSIYQHKGIFPVENMCTKISDSGTNKNINTVLAISQKEINFSTMIVRSLLRAGANPLSSLDTNVPPLWRVVDNYFALAAYLDNVELIRLLLLNVKSHCAEQDTGLEVQVLPSLKENKYHSAGLSKEPEPPYFYIGSRKYRSNPLFHAVLANISNCVGIYSNSIENNERKKYYRRIFEERNPMHAAGNTLQYLLMHTPFKALVNQPEGFIPMTMSPEYFMSFFYERKCFIYLTPLALTVFTARGGETQTLMSFGANPDCPLRSYSSIARFGTVEKKLNVVEKTQKIMLEKMNAITKFYGSYEISGDVAKSAEILNLHARDILKLSLPLLSRLSMGGKVGLLDRRALLDAATDSGNDNMKPYMYMEFSDTSIISTSTSSNVASSREASSAVRKLILLILHVLKTSKVIFPSCAPKDWAKLLSVSWNHDKTQGSLFFGMASLIEQLDSHIWIAIVKGTRGNGSDDLPFSLSSLQKRAEEAAAFDDDKKIKSIWNRIWPPNNKGTKRTHELLRLLVNWAKHVRHRCELLLSKNTILWQFQEEKKILKPFLDLYSIWKNYNMSLNKFLDKPPVSYAAAMLSTSPNSNDSDHADPPNGNNSGGKTSRSELLRILQEGWPQGGDQNHYLGENSIRNSWLLAQGYFGDPDSSISILLSPCSTNGSQFWWWDFYTEGNKSITKSNVDWTLIKSLAPVIMQYENNPSNFLISLSQNCTPPVDLLLPFAAHGLNSPLDIALLQYRGDDSHALYSGKRNCFKHSLLHTAAHAVDEKSFLAVLLTTSSVCASNADFVTRNNQSDSFESASHSPLWDELGYAVRCGIQKGQKTNGSFEKGKKSPSLDDRALIIVDIVENARRVQIDQFNKVDKNSSYSVVNINDEQYARLCAPAMNVHSSKQNIEKNANLFALYPLREGHDWGYATLCEIVGIQGYKMLGVHGQILPDHNHECNSSYHSSSQECWTSDNFPIADCYTAYLVKPVSSAFRRHLMLDLNSPLLEALATSKHPPTVLLLHSVLGPSKLGWVEKGELAPCVYTSNNNNYNNNIPGLGEKKSLAEIAAREGSSIGSLSVLLEQKNSSEDQGTNENENEYDQNHITHGMVISRLLKHETMQASRRLLGASRRYHSLLGVTSKCNVSDSERDSNIDMKCRSTKDDVTQIDAHELIISFINATLALRDGLVEIPQIEIQEIQSLDSTCECNDLRRCRISLTKMLIVACNKVCEAHTDISVLSRTSITQVLYQFFTQVSLYPLRTCLELAHYFQSSDYGFHSISWDVLFPDIVYVGGDTHHEGLSDTPSMHTWHRWLRAFSNMCGSNGTKIIDWVTTLESFLLIPSSGKENERDNINGDPILEENKKSLMLNIKPSEVEKWLQIGQSTTELGADLSHLDLENHHSGIFCNAEQRKQFPWFYKADKVFATYLSAHRAMKEVKGVAKIAKTNSKCYIEYVMQKNDSSHNKPYVSIPEVLLPWLCFCDSDIRHAIFGHESHETSKDKSLICGQNFLLPVLSALIGLEGTNKLREANSDELGIVSVLMIQLTEEFSLLNEKDKVISGSKRKTVTYERWHALDSIVSQLEAVVKDNAKINFYPDKLETLPKSIWESQISEQNCRVIRHAAVSLRAIVNTICTYITDSTNNSCVPEKTMQRKSELCRKELPKVNLLLCAIRGGSLEMVHIVLRYCGLLSPTRKPTMENVIKMSNSPRQIDNLSSDQFEDEDQRKKAELNFSPLKLEFIQKEWAMFIHPILVAAAAIGNLPMLSLLVNSLGVHIDRRQTQIETDDGWTIVHAALTGKEFRCDIHSKSNGSLFSIHKLHGKNGTNNNRSNSGSLANSSILRDRLLAYILRKGLAPDETIFAIQKRFIEQRVKSNMKNANNYDTSQAWNVLDLAAATNSWTNLYFMLWTPKTKGTDIDERLGFGQGLQELCNLYVPPRLYSNDSFPALRYHTRYYPFLHAVCLNCRAEIFDLLSNSVKQSLGQNSFKNMQRIHKITEGNDASNFAPAEIFNWIGGQEIGFLQELFSSIRIFSLPIKKPRTDQSVSTDCVVYAHTLLHDALISGGEAFFDKVFSTTLSVLPKGYIPSIIHNCKDNLVQSLLLYAIYMRNISAVKSILDSPLGVKVVVANMNSEKESQNMFGMPLPFTGMAGQYLWTPLQLAASRKNGGSIMEYLIDTMFAELSILAQTSDNSAKMETQKIRAFSYVCESFSVAILGGADKEAKILLQALSKLYQKDVTSDIHTENIVYEKDLKDSENKKLEENITPALRSYLNKIPIKYQNLDHNSITGVVLKRRVDWGSFLESLLSNSMPFSKTQNIEIEDSLPQLLMTCANKNMKHTLEELIPSDLYCCSSDEITCTLELDETNDFQFQHIIAFKALFCTLFDEAASRGHYEITTILLRTIESFNNTVIKHIPNKYDIVYSENMCPLLLQIVPNNIPSKTLKSLLSSKYQNLLVISDTSKTKEIILNEITVTANAFQSDTEDIADSKYKHILSGNVSSKTEVRENRKPVVIRHEGKDIIIRPKLYHSCDNEIKDEFNK